MKHGVEIRAGHLEVSGVFHKSAICMKLGLQVAMLLEN